MNINSLTVENLTYIPEHTITKKKTEDVQVSNPATIYEKQIPVECKNLIGYFNINNTTKKNLNLDTSIIANADFEKIEKNGLTLKISRKFYLKELTKIIENPEYKDVDKDGILKKLGISEIEGIIDYKGEITLRNFRPNSDKDKQVYDLTQNYLKNNKANKDKYLDDLNIMLKGTSPEYKLDISKRLGIQAINGIIGYNGIISLEKLDRNKKIENEIYNLTNDFINNNEVQLPNKKLSNEINKILKVIPEFINIIGMQQYSFHDFSVDVHTLKVLQNIVTDERYKNLNKEGKQILEHAALLHDIGKREIEESDKDHPKVSAEISKKIIKNQNLSENTKNKILTLIENHNWLDLYDDTRKSKKLEMDVTGRDILNKFGNDVELFKMAQILTEADIKGLKENTENPQIREWLYVLNNLNENFYDLLDESYKIDGNIHIESAYDTDLNSDTIKKIERCHTSFISDEEINLNPKRKSKKVVKGIKGLAQKLENMKPEDLSNLDIRNPENRNKILDIWAWREYDERLNDNPELQEAYIKKFNEICDDNTISIHPGEVFIRTIPVDFRPKTNPDGTFFIGKPSNYRDGTSWPGAAARVQLDKTGNIPEGVIKRLIDDKLTHIIYNNLDNEKCPESTIYVILPKNGCEMKGFDWQKTGTVDESGFGSHAFKKETDENNYPTEVDFSGHTKFKLCDDKKSVKFNLKTKMGTIPVNIVYMTPVS